MEARNREWKQEKEFLVSRITQAKAKIEMLEKERIRIRRNLVITGIEMKSRGHKESKEEI